MLRRRLTVALLLAALPLLSSPVRVAAQQLNTYPGDIVTLAPTQVSVTNSTAAATLFTYSVPPRFFQTNRQPLQGASSLHARLLGRLTTQSLFVGTANLGCNFGGSTASISVVNAATFTASLSAVPVILDLYLGRQGTGLATPVLTGVLRVYTAAGTEVPYAATVVGTTSMTSAQTLACAFNWASQTAGNALVIDHGVLSVGN